MIQNSCFVMRLFACKSLGWPAQCSFAETVSAERRYINEIFN
jgi:hypothetical protein